MELKKLFLLASSALIILSCNEESLEQPQKNLRMVTLSASVEGNDTKASFDETGKLAWSESDAIWVQTSMGSQKFDLKTEHAGQATGDFSGALNNGETLGEIAVYPYHVSNSVSDASEITVTLPNEYGNVTDFNNTNAVMLATDGNEGSYSFKHLGGILRFKISNFPEGATQAVLTTGNAIAGSFKVSQNTDGDNVITSAASSDNNSVALKFAATTAVEEKEISFPLPTGSYTGVKLEIKDAADKVLAVYDNTAKTYTVERANRYNASITFTSIQAGSGEDTALTFYVKTAEELQEAFTEKANIVLMADIALDSETSLSVAQDAEMTLDLNGKTISQTKTCTESYAFITNNGDLTIRGDGKISFTDEGAGDPSYGWGVYTIHNNGTLKVEGGEISLTGKAGVGYAVHNYNGATMQVNGGTITAGGSNYYDGIRLFCGTNQTTVTVNGGTISSIWAQNPSTDQASEVKGTVIINGGNPGTTYYENYTQVKVKSGVSATVISYGNGKDNTTTTEENGYTVYSFVHNN